MVNVDVLFENHDRETVRFTRVPCNSEFISIYGQSFVVQTVMHYAGTEKAEVTVSGNLDRDKMPKPFGPIRMG